MNDKTELERFEAFWNSEFKGVYYTDGKQYARHAWLASAASREAELQAEVMLQMRLDKEIFDEQFKAKEAEIAELKKILADPAAVWTNMLRGTIATPGQLKYLEERVSDQSKEIEELRAKLALAHTDTETIHKKRNDACAELEMRNILLMQLEAKLAVAEPILVKQREVLEMVKHGSECIWHDHKDACDCGRDMAIYYNREALAELRKDKV